MSRAGQIAKALAALVALVALVAGAPVLLWWAAGNPLPDSIDPAEITDALTRPDDGTLFLSVLAVVGWIAWGSFVVAVAVEIVAQVRHRRTRRLPMLSPQQRLAATLVAAVLMIAASPTIASAATTPVYAAPPPTHTAPAAHTPTTPAHQAPPSVRYIVHTVRPGETTASIARLYTGDPSRYHQVLTPNIDRRQADGHALRQGQVSVKPGWVLHIPVDVVTTTVYEIERGDWLSYIAQRFLGDVDAYPEIEALNQDLERRDERFPNHIEQTWRIRLPGNAHDRGEREHATGRLVTQPSVSSTPEPAAPSQPAGPASPGTGGQARPLGSPSASPSPTATVSPTPSPRQAATGSAAPRSSSPPPAADGHQPAEDSMFDQVLLIGVPLFGAGLLAALLLTTLRRRRSHQEQHRPVGRRLPEPVTTATETHLRVVAQPIAVDRLDRALRVLAAGLVDRPADQMPDIVGAWLHADTINLLLTGPCANPPAPWLGDEHNWTLPGDVPLPDVDGQLAPLPTLVAVGSQPGMHLLLDLERLGLLTITGDPRHAGDLLRYLAVELSCNTWSDHVEVTVAGFDAAETGELIALGGERLTAIPTIAAAVERIRRRASQVVRSLDHLGAGDPLIGRIADIAADAWMPHVLLAKDPSAQDIAALQTLDSDLAVTGRCAVAVVTTVGAEVGRWPLSITADGRLGVAFLGMSGPDAGLTAAGLPRDELHNLADLLSTARRGTPGGADAEAAGGSHDWPRVPPAPEPEPWAQATDAAGGLLDDRGDAQPISSRPEPDDVDPTDDEAPEEPALASTGVEPVGADPTEATPAASGPAVVDEIARVPAVVALPGRQATPRKPVTSPTRRRHSDPTLDADVRAWNDADPHRPRIAILGMVTVEAPGRLPAERVRFYAEIITYLAVRGQRGATTDQFDEALWPGQQVKATSRRVAVARARRWLGETTDGEAWLPDATGDRRYRLREGYLLDWHLFRRLRSRGENRGPAGVSDLRQALTLVRGAPLAGADVAYSAAARNPYVWLPASEVQPHHLAAAVVDTAHRMVDLCLDGGDIAGARWAVDQAWLADPDRASDIAWRDLMRVAAAEGNTAELDQMLGELMRARDAEVPEDLDRDTYRLLCELLPDRMRAGVLR